MIQKHYSAYCVECADHLPLVAQTMESARGEVMSKGWEEHNKEWYCPSCSLRRIEDEVNGENA